MVKNLPPVKQKLAYIKGIARNRFSYWDDRKGSIILSNYVIELEKHYDENQLLEDLENEVSRITKDAKNWSEWRKTIENWTSDIQNWNKKAEQPEIKEYSLEQLENFVFYGSCEQEDAIKALEHIASIFPKFDKDCFRKTITDDLILFLKFHNNTEQGETDFEKAKEYIDEHIQLTKTNKCFEFDENDVENLGVLIVLQPIVNGLLKDIFFCSYYPTYNMKKEDKDKMIEININHLEKNNGC